MAIRKPHGDAGHPCLRWPEMPTACVHRCYHRKRTMCLQGLAAAVPLDAAEGAYETGRLPERARVTFAPARQLNLLAVVSKQHHDKAITLGDADLRFRTSSPSIRKTHRRMSPLSSRGLVDPEESVK